MSGAVVVNRLRRDFYLDSIALMRLSRELAAERDVIEAALMIGSEANIRLLADGGLLADEGEDAGPNDLILAVRAKDARAANSALDRADGLLARASGVMRTNGGEVWRPRSLNAAGAALPTANLALISVPGEFAAAEARKAIALGLNPMIFSGNVSLAAERSLKELACARGLLVMGPDCGTALVGGVPLAFANEVPLGDIGIVSASGTGLQEVSCLIARHGRGVSHGIGVGGRDLTVEVGALSTQTALDLLQDDPATRHIILISKPPAPEIARRVLDRVAKSGKPTTICFLGHRSTEMPPNARQVDTLRDAASSALGADMGAFDVAATIQRVKRTRARSARRMVGLFCGGTLCTEAQVVLAKSGVSTRSNVPLQGQAAGTSRDHEMLDLGAEEYTLGRPHPMIDPTPRGAAIRRAVADPSVGAIMLDVVLGYGAHPDPAAAIATTLSAVAADRPIIVASVTGTNGDPQRYDAQARRLEQAGVVTAPSNADAASLALALIGAGQ